MEDCIQALQIINEIIFEKSTPVPTIITKNICICFYQSVGSYQYDELSFDKYVKLQNNSLVFTVLLNWTGGNKVCYSGNINLYGLLDYSV